MPSAARVMKLDHELECPKCGGDVEARVHIESVAVHQDRDVTIVERVGTRREESTVSSGRGSLVEVRFWCEEGHRFARRFGFHKGVVYEETRARADFSPGGDQPSELWRD